MVILCVRSKVAMRVETLRSHTSSDNQSQKIVTITLESDDVFVVAFSLFSVSFFYSSFLSEAAIFTRSEEDERDGPCVEKK